MFGIMETDPRPRCCGALLRVSVAFVQPWRCARLRFRRFSEFEASSDPFPVCHAHRQDRVVFAFRSVRNTRFLRARHVSFGVRSTVEFALNRAPAQAYVWVGRPATCFDAFRGAFRFVFVSSERLRGRKRVCFLRRRV